MWRSRLALCLVLVLASRETSGFGTEGSGGGGDGDNNGGGPAAVINATHVGEAVVLAGAAKAHHLAHAGEGDDGTSGDGNAGEGSSGGDGVEEHLDRERVIAMAATLAEAEVEDRKLRLRRMHAHPEYRPMTEEERQSASMLNMLLFIMVSSQYVLFVWKKRHFESYQQATLAGVWLFPFCLSLYLRFWRFLAFWGVYSFCTSYYVRLAMKKPLPRDGPGAVYAWFLNCHSVTHLAAVGGYIFILADFMGLSPCNFLAYLLFKQDTAAAAAHQQAMIAAAHAHRLAAEAVGTPGQVAATAAAAAAQAAVVATRTAPIAFIEFVRAVCVTCMVYGIYFGVLTRDAAEVCTQRISTALGIAKKFEGESEMTEWQRKNVCALCGDDLQPSQALALAHPSQQHHHHHHHGGAGSPRKRKVDEPLFTLKCGHTFHESCIRGWTIVGKQNQCPYCVEPVDLSRILGSSPWQKQSLVWIHLLDAVRYLIVWHPIILAMAHFVVHMFYPHATLLAHHHHQAMRGN